MSKRLPFIRPDWSRPPLAPPFSERGRLIDLNPRVQPHLDESGMRAMNAWLDRLDAEDAQQQHGNVSVATQAPRRHLQIEVALRHTPAPHPLQHVASVAWRWFTALRHLDVVLCLYYALLGLVATPVLLRDGPPLGALAMALVGGFFCWVAVVKTRMERPQRVPEQPESEYPAWHYPGIH